MSGTDDQARVTSKAAAFMAEEDRLKEVIHEAVVKAFSAGVEDKRYIDITRVPLICQSIIGIDKRLSAIESNFVWGTRVVIGAIILGVLGLLLKLNG